MKKPPSLPEHLRPIWDEMENEVSERIGAAGLEALCGQVYRMRTAEDRVSREGIVVADVKGNPAPHPALAIEKQAQAEVRAWLLKYGRRR